MCRDAITEGNTFFPAATAICQPPPHDLSIFDTAYLHAPMYTQEQERTQNGSSNTANIA